MHRLTICCALSLALTACSADDGDEQAFDDGLKVDTTLLRLSAPAEDPASGDDRILMVGLEGAAPAGARFEVRPEGVDEILATGLVRDDGSFAVWVEHTEARPVVRLSTDRAEGPDTPINRSAAELRALAASLTFAQGDNTGGTVRGVVGAAVASSRVVVAQPGGGVSTATASDRGEFSLHTTARSGDTVAVFALDETLEKTSPAQVLEVTTDGFAVVISGARGTPTGAIAFAPADSLPADTPVSITRGATSVPVGFASVFGDGGFGACFAEASVNDVLSFSAEVEGSTRLADFEVPGNQGLVPLLNPTIVGTVDGDEVGLKGNAPGAVGYVVSINCDNGSRAIATVGGDGTFELSQLGVEGQVLGVVGIGVGGELGIAQFGATQPLSNASTRRSRSRCRRPTST